MALEVAAERAGGATERLLERGVEEGLDGAAAVAHEMVMVARPGAGRLEASDAVPDVDALDEAELGELGDGAVDARDADAGPARADAVEDLPGREAARLRAEVLDDGPACASAAEPGGSHAVERLDRPARRL